MDLFIISYPFDGWAFRVQVAYILDLLAYFKFYCETNYTRSPQVLKNVQGLWIFNKVLEIAVYKNYDIYRIGNLSSISEAPKWSSA